MSQVNNKKTKATSSEPVTPKVIVPPSSQPKLQCKSCGEQSDYSANYGKYGYFIKCNKCEVNTAMKTPCISCNSKSTKVSKKKERYTLHCNDCSHTVTLI